MTGALLGLLITIPAFGIMAEQMWYDKKRLKLLEAQVHMLRVHKNIHSKVRERVQLSAGDYLEIHQIGAAAPVVFEALSTCAMERLV